MLYPKIVVVAGLAIAALTLALGVPDATAQQSGSHLEIVGSNERFEGMQATFAILPFERPVRNNADGYSPTVASNGGGPLRTQWAPPVDIVWDFGDGSPPVSTGERVSVAHVFEEQGNYSVRVTAAEAGEIFAEGTHQVTITNRKPSWVRLRAAPAVGIEGGIDFTASALDTPEDTLTYRWDFGDGQQDEGEDLWKIRHVYTASGDFTVKLTVSDEDGGEDEEEVEVRVAGVVEQGSPPAPIDPGDEPEAVIDGLQGTVSGALSAELDADIRSLRGLFLSPISSGSCRFMFTAWDDALLAYALIVLDFSHLAPEGGKYRFTSPQVALTFEPDAEAYLFHRERGLGSGGAGIGGRLESLFSDPEALESLLGGLAGTVQDGVGEEWRERARQEVGIDPRAREEDEPEPNVVPAVSPFGLEEAARLGSASGTFDLTFRPRRYAQGTLNVSLKSSEEGPLGGAPVSLVNVEFALDLNAAMRDGMFNYDCDDGTLEIDARWPEPDSLHVLPSRPPVRASFDRRVDPTSVSDETLQLVYPDETGDWVPVEGRRLVAKYSTILVPDEPLKPGVRHTIRVKTGDDGLRALDGSVLEDTEGDGWQRWSFSSRIDFAPTGPTADQLLACHLFQTARDPRLIAGKPALARVWARWPKHPDVLPDAQTEIFEAKVILADRTGQELASTSKLFVRPDLWAERGIATDSGMHTAQIFGFEPRDQLDLPLRIRVEVPTEPGKTKRLYTAVCPTELWERQPEVTVEYFALKAYEWSTPEAFDIVLPALREIVRSVDTYAEELFPLTDLIAYPGIREIEIPSDDEPDSPEGCDTQCWNATYHSLLLQRSTADIVVAFLPHKINSGGNTEGTLRSSRATIIFAAGTNADNFSRYVNGVVHEIGHALTLPHLPLIADGQERARLVALRDAGAPFWFKGIEGYRLNPTGTTGWNKSSVEGNEEDDILVPLMFPGTYDRTRAFISHHHYLQIQRLFDDIGD